MATWADVEAQGYGVVDDAPGVRRVAAEGVLLYVRDDDQETIDALANPAPPEPTPLAESTPAAVVPQLAKDASLADVIARLNELTA